MPPCPSVVLVYRHKRGLGVANLNVWSGCLSHLPGQPPPGIVAGRAFRFMPKNEFVGLDLWSELFEHHESPCDKAQPGLKGVKRLASGEPEGNPRPLTRELAVDSQQFMPVMSREEPDFHFRARWPERPAWQR